MFPSWPVFASRSPAAASLLRVGMSLLDLLFGGKQGSAGRKRDLLPAERAQPAAKLVRAAALEAAWNDGVAACLVVRCVAPRNCP